MLHGIPVTYFAETSSLYKILKNNTWIKLRNLGLGCKVCRIFLDEQLERIQKQICEKAAIRSKIVNVRNRLHTFPVI